MVYTFVVNIAPQVVSRNAKQARLCGTRLNADTLREGTAALARIEPGFSRIVHTYGPPQLWVRAPGFPTLVRLILEQQVSLVSARAVYRRVCAAADVRGGRIGARHVFALGEDGLRRAGFTRQKASYVHGIAQDMVSGRLRLAAIDRLPGAEARAALLSIRGVGPWTADVYRLVALRELDVWPHGDVALADAAHRLLEWPSRPAQDALTAHAAQWAPWRSVAARLLWHGYLSMRAAR